VVDRTLRRRTFDVALALLVGLAASAATWWLVDHVQPRGLALVAVVSAAVLAAISLRGYGHLQLAISSGTNLTLEWFALQSLLP
jgi:hypothetical protein